MQSAPVHNQHYRAFNDEFFARHQQTLLWLLNAKLTRRWFRWVLRVHRDCPRGARIVEILPHAYVVGAGYVQVDGEWHEQRIADFRAHPKFAKRLYHAFKPLWWALHVWDTIYADRFDPRLSFGFSTLTAFPASGTSSPIDGTVARTGVSEGFSTIRSGSGNFTDGGTSSQDAPAQNSATATTNLWDTIERGIFLFDTSSLTSAALISAAVFSLFVVSHSDAFTMAVRLVTSTPASNSALANSDYANLGTVAQATDVPIAGVTDSAYNAWTLNGTGFGNVSKTSITKFGTRTDKDADNTTPTWSSGGNSRIVTKLADQAGTTNDPKLVVTYVIPITQTLTESVTMSDTVLKTPSRVLSDTITLTGSMIRSVARTLVDTITTSDVIAAGIIPHAILTETITLLDSTVRTVSRTLTDAVTMTATVIRATARIFTESITLIDTLQRTVSKVLTEVLSLFDTIMQKLNGSSTLYARKFTARGTDHDSKFTERGTTHTTKF